MPVHLDQDISGHGEAAAVAGNGEVIYALIHLTALGPDVRFPDISDSSMIIRAGWWTMGAQLSVIGGVNRRYWEFPIHIDMVDQRWVPNGGAPGTTVPVHRANWFRWRLSPGTTGHIYVFGN